MLIWRNNRNQRHMKTIISWVPTCLVFRLFSRSICSILLHKKQTMCVCEMEHLSITSMASFQLLENIRPKRDLFYTCSQPSYQANLNIPEKEPPIIDQASALHLSLAELKGLRKASTNQRNCFHLKHYLHWFRMFRNSAVPIFTLSTPKQLSISPLQGIPNYS